MGSVGFADAAEDKGGSVMDGSQWTSDAVLWLATLVTYDEEGRHFLMNYLMDRLWQIEYDEWNRLAGLETSADE